MKLHYYKETDSLYIEFNSNPNSDSKEISNDVVLDLDNLGNIVGLDIQNASKKLDLNTLETTALPTLSSLISAS